MFWMKKKDILFVRFFSSLEKCGKTGIVWKTSPGILFIAHLSWLFKGLLKIIGHSWEKDLIIFEARDNS